MVVLRDTVWRVMLVEGDGWDRSWRSFSNLNGSVK